MSDFTPGPWQATAGLARWNVTTAAKPRTLNICTVNTDRLEQAANARLIAAAPDLYAALRNWLVCYGDRIPAHAPLMMETRAALAKVSL